MNATMRKFRLLGNHVCLDFINTVDDRTSDAPGELLSNFGDLVTWSRQTDIVTDAEVQQLLEEAGQSPGEAEAVRQRAVRIRETLYHIFSTLANGSSPDESDLQTFNAALAEAMSHARVVPAKDGFGWDWSAKETSLDRMLWTVLREAADLLTSEDLHIIRQCAADDCSWLFLDTSKNHSRRWCDMKNCGNRSKVSRYYERKKQVRS